MDLACFSGRYYISDAIEQDHLQNLTATVSDVLDVINQEKYSAYAKHEAWQKLENILRAKSQKWRSVLTSECAVVKAIVSTITSRSFEAQHCNEREIVSCLMLVLECQTLDSTNVQACLRCLLNCSHNCQQAKSTQTLQEQTTDTIGLALCETSILRLVVPSLEHATINDSCEQLQSALRRATDKLTLATTILLKIYILHRASATNPAAEQNSSETAQSLQPMGTTEIRRTDTVDTVDGTNEVRLTVQSTDRAQQLLHSWSTLLSLVSRLNHFSLALNQIINNPSDTTDESPLGQFLKTNGFTSKQQPLIHTLTELCTALHYAGTYTSSLTPVDADLPPLESAFKAGQVAAVVTVLHALPGLARCSNHEQQTLLHRCAALDTHIDSDATTAMTSPSPLEALLQCPFYTDAVDACGRTALFYCRNATNVRALCQHGADANALDERGVAPLHHFVLAENLDCVHALLESGADPTISEPMKRRNAIHFAASLCNYRLVEAILTKAEYALDVNQTDASGNTALLLAAACQIPGSDPLKTILLLLNRDASVKVQNNQGISVLHLVCSNPLLSTALEPLVEMLLQKGANPNAQDSDGCTPLIVACAYREFSVCKALLHAGGDLNILCRMHSTFLSLGFVDGDSDPDSASQSRKSDDSAAGAAHAHHAITASDLLPKKPRYAVFSSISCAQSKIRSVNRDRCMNCGDYFAGDGPGASFIDALHLTTGRHHCRHCRRVVCPGCAQHTLSASCVPAFVRTAYASESTYRVCDVCYDVLSDRSTESRIDASADWTESEASSGDTRDPQEEGGTSVNNSAPNTPYGAQGRTPYFSLAAFGFEF